MKQVILEPLAAAPLHTCAQLNAIHDAAASLDHPLAALPLLSILAPGVADVIPGVDVRHIDLRAGTMFVPVVGGVLHEVALGSRAMDVVEELVAGRTSGFLLADDHGSPVWPDRDASDYVAELLNDADPSVRGFDWNLYSLRCAAFGHMAMNGVSNQLLAASSGFWPMPTTGRARHLAQLEQIMVADYWPHLLDHDRLASAPVPAAVGIARPSDTSFGWFAMTAGSA